jgi:hypothetical protein
MYLDPSRLTRSGKTSTRPLRRASYRAHGQVLHRTLAHVSPWSEAELAALRLALRYKGEREHLGPLQAALTLPQGPSFGAVWTLYHGARRWGIAQALGTTRAGTRALWQVSARGSAQGSRLSAVRLALSHAACDVLGVGPVDADALYAHLAWLAGAQARSEERLGAQRQQPPPARLFLDEGTSRYVEGTPHALAALGSNRAGKQGKPQRVMGLLCAEDGPPVSIAVFPGTPPAPRTVAAQMAQRKGRLGVTALPCVGDRGLRKGQQGEDLAQHGFHDMTALTQPQRDQRRRPGVWPLALGEQA